MKIIVLFVLALSCCCAARAATFQPRVNGTEVMKAENGTGTNTTNHAKFFLPSLSTNGLVSVAADGSLRTNKVGSGLSIAADGTLDTAGTAGISVTKTQGVVSATAPTTLGYSNSPGITWGALSNAAEITYIANLDAVLSNFLGAPPPTNANAQQWSNLGTNNISNLIGATQGLTTAVANLQGATNGLNTRVGGHDTDIANLQGGTNGLNTAVANLQGGTNGLNAGKVNIQSGAANALTSTNETLRTTASNSVPLIVDGAVMQRTNLQTWMTNGVPVATVTSNGTVQVADGTATVAGYGFVSAPNSGLFLSSGAPRITTAGASVAGFVSGSGIYSVGAIGLGSVSNPSLDISTPGAGIAVIRNPATTTSATTNRVTGSFTNSSNAHWLESGYDNIHSANFVRSMANGLGNTQPLALGAGTNHAIVLNTNHTITVRETINTMSAPTNTAAFLTDTNDIVPGQIYVGPAQRFSLSFDAYATATLAAGAICILNYSNAAAGVIQTVGRFTIPSGILASDIMTNQMVLVNAEPNSMYWLTNATGGQPASLVTGSFRRTGQ